MHSRGLSERISCARSRERTRATMPSHCLLYRRYCTGASLSPFWWGGSCRGAGVVVGWHGEELGRKSTTVASKHMGWRISKSRVGGEDEDDKQSSFSFHSPLVEIFSSHGHRRREMWQHSQQIVRSAPLATEGDDDDNDDNVDDRAVSQSQSRVRSRTNVRV